MRIPAKRLFAAALALSLFAGARARADFVSWSYNWTPTATTIYANTPSMGSISLSNEQGGTAVGDSFIVATNIKTASTALPTNPAIFTNAAYGLSLTIVDGPSGKSGSLSWNGAFTGTLSSGSALITNSFSSPIMQSVQIGSHLYTVNIGPFAPPGPPSANISGSISALATVTVRDVPEPGTLVLSGLGLGLCGAGWWLRRARRNFALDLA